MYLSVGQAGAFWEETSGCKVTAERLFLRKLRGGSEKRMLTSLQVLRRWHAWAKADKDEAISA